MRLGVAWEPNSNAYYRAVYPMSAMERRGHEVVWPRDDGAPELRRLSGCDAVHVYRWWTPEMYGLLSELVRSGVPITYDNDDDFTATPKESPHYRDAGGLKGQRAFAMSVKVARLASCLTTTTERLGEKYRRAGIEPAEVIGNFLAPDTHRPRNRHDGVVIGWIAAHEHYADAARLGIAETLRHLLDRHKDVRVECIGVDLALPTRYRHDNIVHFDELPRRIGGFDIGLAPLADLPINQARSDIKVKEYAASGVPWLASPVGPYQRLGEKEGGRLVPDDGWPVALERLVTHARDRRRLARKAKKWAQDQTIDAVADRWEQVFAAAAR
jgi:glycosyltransferase involved in cell wall biosynthesis